MYRGRNSLSDVTPTSCLVMPFHLIAALYVTSSLECEVIQLLSILSQMPSLEICSNDNILDSVSCWPAHMFRELPIITSSTTHAEPPHTKQTPIPVVLLSLARSFNHETTKREIPSRILSPPTLYNDYSNTRVLFQDPLSSFAGSTAAAAAAASRTLIFSKIGCSSSEASPDKSE